MVGLFEVGKFNYARSGVA